MVYVGCTNKPQLPEKSAIAKKNSIVLASELKRLLEDDKGILKELVRSVVQQTLEAEMDAALGATKGERTDGVWAITVAIMAAR